jgi:hypothetical protein
VEFLIKLKKVNSDNIWDVIKLSVSEQQKNFVASNRESILEAYATIADGNMALPFAIYNDDTLVGFVMFGYGSTGDEDEPKISAGSTADINGWVTGKRRFRHLLIICIQCRAARPSTAGFPMNRIISSRKNCIHRPVFPKTEKSSEARSYPY